MSELDHLGDALRLQLHAAVDDLSPSAEMMATVDAIPSRRRPGGPLTRLGRGRRRIAVAISLPIAAILAAAVVLLGGSGVTPSYAGAILVLPDGEVRVTMSQIINVASANAELRSHRIFNMVVRPMTASCPEHPSMTYIGGALVPAPKITLTPRTVARGWTVVLAAKQIAPNEIEQALGRFKGRVPSCVSSRGTGPGLGNWAPTKADKANYKKAR